MRAVLFSPHADDESLFAAYSVLRYRPEVIICFPSERDYGTTEQRFAESRAALSILGVTSVTQWHGSDSDFDLIESMLAYDREAAPEVVLAPSPASSHPHHVAVANAAGKVFGDRVVHHHTYNHQGKVREGLIVPVEDGWPELKRQALACYRSQIQHERACVFFDEQQFELDEYVPLRTDGPTIETYVRAGYQAAHYPPSGYTEVPSAGLTRYRQTGELDAPPAANDERGPDPIADEPESSDPDHVRTPEDGLDESLEQPEVPPRMTRERKPRGKAPKRGA